MMLITNEHLKLYNAYLGQGPVHKASILFFGNESGLASITPEKSINWLENIVKEKQYTLVGNTWEEGFFTKSFRDKPIVNSTYVRYLGRFILALTTNDDRWLGNLSEQGKIAVNNYLLNELHENVSCYINLRPLPRPTENHWIYENINQNSYLNSYNFNKVSGIPEFTKPRIKNILRGLYAAKNKPLIIATGDKYNKKSLFEKILPYHNFEEIILKNGKKIFIDFKQKIILCDYFDNRVIGIDSVKEIYFIVKENNLY
jgi:hypothetical protein